MKTPFVTRSQAESIAAQYPTPYHIYDAHGIRENARCLQAAFAWNPGYREYFAVKATPTPAILKLLHSEGCGCDCSSLTELMMAERCGVTGEEIMFSSNNTAPEEFRLAAKLGAVINLDDLTLVDALVQALDGKLPKKLCCRFNPGGLFTLGESHEGFQVMDNPGDAKYGMTRPQLAEAFRRLSAMGVEEFGIHAFLASNTLSNDYYPALARILFQLAVDLHRETGVNITFINLSGGVGIPYRPEESANDIAAIGEGVRRAYEEILTPAGLSVSLCTELGRFMLGPYGHLITRAIHQKHTYKEYVGVDACACNLMRPAMYGAYHHITVLGKETAPCDHVYDVVGSLCENNDKFAVDRSLPEILPGDLLCIHDTGAHGFSMGYNYNGKLKSCELLLREDGTVELIRRAETPEDYFATLVW